MYLSLNDYAYLMTVIAIYADWDMDNSKYLISFNDLIYLINDMLMHKEKENA